MKEAFEPLFFVTSCIQISMSEFRKLTSEEVFHIFKEEHRLCSPIDPESDPDFDLQPTSTVAEWLDAGDLLPWMELRVIYNEWFSIEISKEEWRMTAGFSNEKPMQGVFELIARHAKIETIQPIKILGQTCLSAAIFKSIKKHLNSKGIDTSELSPSSKIEPVLKKNFADFISHINKNFTGIIPEIKKTETTLSKFVGFAGLVSILSLAIGYFWHDLIFISIASFIIAILFAFIEKRSFDKKEGMLVMPGIVTFRDLVNRIIESRNIRQSS